MLRLRPIGVLFSVQVFSGVYISAYNCQMSFAFLTEGFPNDKM